MSRIDPDTQQQLQKAIAAHLQTNGNSNWNPLRAKFTSVSRATFFRYVKAVKDAPPDPRATHKARRRARTIDAVNETAKHLPAVPSPHYLAKHGEDAVAELDFLGRINGLLLRTERLHEYASEHDDNGNFVKITDPNFYALSIRLEKELLAEGRDVLETVWGLRQQQHLHDAILRAIGQVSPEAQQLVAKRMREVNREYGLTAYDTRLR